VRRCPAATPFQNPEWLLAYARTFCRSDGSPEAWALVARRGGALVALAPLCTRQRTRRPGDDGEHDARESTSLLGEGSSDYLDVVADPTISASFAMAVLERLKLRHRDADGLVLERLREGSPLLTCAVPEGVSDERSTALTCPFISLGA